MIYSLVCSVYISNAKVKMLPDKLIAIGYNSGRIVRELVKKAILHLKCSEKHLENI